MSGLLDILMYGKYIYHGYTYESSTRNPDYSAGFLEHLLHEENQDEKS
jgi:hypothetical protein